jgi:hypothetical protein
VRLELTAAGQKALEQIYQELASNASKVFDVLGPSRPQFLNALRLVQAALLAVDEPGA